MEGDDESDKFKLEEEKLQIERDKLKLEQLRVEIELRKTKWMAISVAVPIVAAILTILYGLWGTRQQSISQFQLEIAKSILQAPTPYDAAGRLQFFVEMFPSTIPENFAKVPNNIGAYDSGIRNAKREFIKTVSDRGLTPRQTVSLWMVMFSGADWPAEAAISEAIRN